MLTIGDRIRQRREQIGMSQAELAALSGYKSRTSINKIELGERDIRQNKIKAIADALHTSPAYLMGWEDAPDNSKKEKPSEYEGLSDAQVSLLEFARSVPDDKAELALRLIRTIVEDD